MDTPGVSAVTIDGAAVLAKILDGYADVFSCGPTKLRLNCGVYWISTGRDEDDTARNMLHSMQEFPRDETVASVRRIAEAARRANRDGDNWFIAIQGL